MGRLKGFYTFLHLTGKKAGTFNKHHSNFFIVSTTHPDYTTLYSSQIKRIKKKKSERKKNPPSQKQNKQTNKPHKNNTPEGTPPPLRYSICIILRQLNNTVTRKDTEMKNISSNVAFA